MNTIDRRVLLFLAGIIGGVIALLARDVQAQPLPQGEVVRVLVIAAWAEADATRLVDHAGIWHVLAKRARSQGRGLADLARRYVSIFKVAVLGHPRTRWLRAIDARCEKPDGWPARSRWRAELCQSMFARAEAFLHGEVPDPFEGRACNWGAPYGIDRERAARFGWTQVDGPKTANNFWSCQHVTAANNTRRARPHLVL